MQTKSAIKNSSSVQTVHLTSAFKHNISEPEFFTSYYNLRQNTISKHESLLAKGISNNKYVVPITYIPGSDKCEILLSNSEAMKLLNDYPSV